MKSALLSCLLAGTLIPAARAADHTSTWNGAISSDWNVGGNWTTPTAPGTFPNNGTATYDAVLTGGSVTVNVPVTIERFTLSGGTNTGAGSTLTTNDLFTFSGGTLNGSGAVSAAAFTWTNGAFGGSRSVDVSGALTLSGPSTKSVGTTGGQSPTLTNNGTADLTGGNLQINSTGTGQQGAFVNNGSFNATDNADLAHGTLGGGGSPSFNNTSTGVFNKSGPGTVTHISSGLAFSNHGMVNVISGNLEFQGGTIGGGGSYNVDAGAALHFTSGTTSLSAASTVSGAGTVRFPDGAAILAGSYNITGTTAISGGMARFEGASTATSTSLDWTAGQIGGALAVSGGITLSGTSPKWVGAIGGQSASLTSNGTANLSGGNLQMNSTGSGKQGVFVNNGTFNVTDGADVVHGTIGGGGLPAFNNTSTGTFNKSGPGTVTHITGGLAFGNNGVVNVDSGTLEFQGGVIVSGGGSIEVDAGATLQINGGPNPNDETIHTTFPASGTISGAGNVIFAGATSQRIILGGSYNVTGITTISGGDTEFNAVSAASATTLNWTAGFIRRGNLVVNGLATISGSALKWIASTGNQSATFTNNGTTDFSGGDLQLNSTGAGTQGAFINNGIFNAKDNAGLRSGFLGGPGNPAFTNTATGILEKSGAGTTTTFHPSLNFTNSGIVRVTSGILEFSNNYTQTAGALVLNGGSVTRGSSTSPFEVKGGKIQGGGTITGAVTSAGGTVIIEPGIGTTTGTLAITGDLTLTSGSKLSFDIGGTTAGTQHDKVTESAGSTTSVAGVTLEVGSLLGSFFPAPGDQFVVFDAATTAISGSFANGITNGSRIATTDGKGTFKVNYGSGTAIIPPTGSNADKVILSDFQTTPTSLTLDDHLIVENAPAPRTVGLLGAIDPNPAETFTFALTTVSGVDPTDDDNGLFEISGNQLQAKSNTLLDFETKSSYKVRLRVTNSRGGFLEQAFTIQVQDVPSPTDLALGSNSFPENRAAGHVVGVLSATNPPGGGDPVTFSVVSVDGSTTSPLAFAVSGGNLVTNRTFDFEATPGPFNVLVRATNQGGESVQQTFSVALTNDGPSAPALSHSFILAGRPVGTTVGTFSATVVPEGSELAYSLVSGTGDTHNAEFTIDGATLKAAVVPNFAAGQTRSIRVRATGPGTEFAEQVFTIIIVQAGPPTDIALSASSVAENQPVDTVVGTLTATDPDPETVFTFTLADGPGDFDRDNFRFNLQTDLSGNTRLRTSQVFDKEAEMDLSLRGPFNIFVRVTNSAGEYYEEQMTITVTDIPSPTEIALSNSSISENRFGFETIGTLSATDPNPGVTFTYELVTGPGSEQNHLFRIQGTDLLTNDLYNFETLGPTLNVRVRVTNNVGEFYEKPLTITLTDEGPVNLGLSSSSVLETDPAGTVVGTLSGDVVGPPGVTISGWTLVDGPGILHNNFFTIQGNVLKTNDLMDHEMFPICSIRVRAIDSANESFDQTFTITVGDVHITDITLSGTTVPENLPAGVVIGTLGMVTDPPVTGVTPEFSIHSATPNNAVQIIEDNKLVTTRALSRSDEPTISLRLRVEHYSDRVFEFLEKDVVITVEENRGQFVIENPPGTSLGAGSGTLDMGDTEVGLSTEQIVTLRNTGTGHIFFFNQDPAFQDGPFTWNFLDAPGDFGPGASVRLRLRFSPQSAGNANGQIRFHSPYADDYVLNLTARGTAPEISVQQPLGAELVNGAALDFGRQPFGVNFPARTFIVKNVGVSTGLSIGATIDGPDSGYFVLDTQGFANTSFIPAGESSSFRVTFQPEPDVLRSYDATLRITSNDADENPFEIPLTGEGVTPLMIAQTAYAKASDTGAGDELGFAVAVSGNTVVVGAPSDDGPNDGLLTDSGSVYVFVRNAVTGAWSHQAKLCASNPGKGDDFGISVAISGETLVVGARFEDSSTTGTESTPNEGAMDAGAAYVFVRSGTTWSQQAYLKASQVSTGDQFGSSVAVSGDTVVVGATGEDSSTTGVNSTPDESAINAGAAYLFVRSGTTWSQQAYLKASQVSVADQFGASVALSGDTVVVGANGEDSSTTGVNSIPNELASGAGAAYVFVRSGTAWEQQAYLKASQVSSSDNFGGSVAVSGDTVVVGAAGEDSSSTGINSTSNESMLNAGAAYVFVRGGTDWSQQAYLKANQITADDRFGISVAVSGDTVVVGAFGEDSSTTGINSTPNESAPSSGASYVFTRSGAAWGQQAYLKASQVTAGDRFALRVALGDDTVVIGADLEDSSTTGINSTPDESAPASGAAYIFEITSPEVVVHDGDTTGSPKLVDNLAQAVDFGTTPLGISVTRPFTIQNLRTLPLTVSGITAPDGFIVTGVPTGPIPAQGSATFFIRLDGSTLGNFSGEVIISSDDGANPAFTFPVTGQVVALPVGSLDPRFGNGGVARVDLGLNDLAYDMLMLPDGRLVIGGESFVSDDVGGGRFALVRLLPDGNSDSNFGTSGQVLTTVPGIVNPGAAITGICLQGPNIVAAGNRRNGRWMGQSGQPAYALARYRPDGSLDDTFGTDGLFIDSSLAEGDGTGDVVASASGKLLVGGTQISSGAFRAFVRRFNQAGSIDSSFGNNGTLLPTQGRFGGAIALNAAGEIFTAGSISSGFVMRIWKSSADGVQLNATSFPQIAPPGYPTETAGLETEIASAVVLQTDGRPVIAARRWASPDPRAIGHGFITARTTDTLLLDSTFNGTAARIEDIDSLVNSEQANSIAVQPDGKLVVAGTVGGKFVVVRYQPNGEIDLSFGTDGKLILDLGANGSAYKVLLDAAGDIYVAGHASNGNNQDFVVVKIIGSIVHEPAIIVRNGSSASAPVISNGQASAIDYGSRQISFPASKSFRIENLGTAPLTITSITVPTGYQVFNNPGSIAAGAASTLSIVLKANALGTFSGPVTITTNDPTQGIFSFLVTGQVVANSPPVYSPLTVETVEGKPVTISFEKLIGKVTDANGDSISIASFSPLSQDGASITQVEKSLVFSQPVPLAGTDTFEVRFSDGAAQITGVVTVNVATDTTIVKNVPKVEPIAGGNVKLTFSGAADTNYSIQQSPDNVNFSQIGTAKTQKGKVVFTTTTPPPPNATFRIRQISLIPAP